MTNASGPNCCWTISIACLLSLPITRLSSIKVFLISILQSERISLPQHSRIDLLGFLYRTTRSNLGSVVAPNSIAKAELLVKPLILQVVPGLRFFALQYASI